MPHEDTSVNGLALSAFVALATAATTVGITASWAADLEGFTLPWWMIMLLACGSVSLALALATLLVKLCAPKPGLTVLTCLAGLVVHAGMMVAYTVYLASGDVNDFGINLFDLWSDWTSEAQALYVFGVVIGVVFWLLALIFALVAQRAAADRAQAAIANLDAQLGQHPAKQEQFYVAV